MSRSESLRNDFGPERGLMRVMVASAERGSTVAVLWEEREGRAV